MAALLPESVQPQDLALTLLGAYVLPRPRPVWSGGLVKLLGESGFSKPAARVALSRLVNRGLLERSKQGRLVHYRLSARCERLLQEGDQRIFGFGGEEGWDGSWTILWHWIPEERKVERARLARRLRFLGFGSVHDGTWISAHDREADVIALISDLEVEPYAGVLVGRPRQQLHLRTLVTRAWDLDRLARRYKDFIRLFGPFADARAKKALDGQEAFWVRTAVVHSFRRFPSLDPELPDEMLSVRVRRRESAAIFNTVYDGLTDLAQRYFDSHTAPPERSAGEVRSASR